MKIVDGNVFNVDADYIVIPTNGYVRKDGNLVMGRGVANEAAIRWEWLPKHLGNFVKASGNVVCKIRPDENKSLIVPAKTKKNYGLISFPVKPAKTADRSMVLPHFKPFYPMPPYPGFICRADVALIEISATQMLEAIAGEDCIVAMPLVGCGSGGLKWEQVRPALDKIIKNDNRIFVVNYAGK